MLNLDEIKAIARRARQWAEKYQKENKTHFRSDLCGMCGIASAYLVKLYEQAGITADIWSCDGHAFVLVEEFIVDITATQFGDNIPKVVVLPKAVAVKEHWYYAMEYHSGPAEKFIENQSMWGWPVEQRAKKELLPAYGE